MELQGSQTEKNLQFAFAGESQATVKYGFYGAQADKDGYRQIGDIFRETSGNERAHAKMWFKALHGGKVPATLENLKDAASGEHHEWTEMYKGFAETAKEEGFDDIAKLFEGVATIEHGHDDRYNELIDRVNKGEVFKRGDVIAWKCLNCGYVYVGKEAPKVCPVCGHPQSFFEEQAKNY